MATYGLCVRATGERQTGYTNMGDLTAKVELDITPTNHPPVHPNAPSSPDQRYQELM